MFRSAERPDASQRLGARVAPPRRGVGERFVDVAHAGPVAKAGDVVGPSGLGGRPDARSLPAAEGLSVHDGPGRAAIHVEVAPVDRVDPALALGRVQRVHARGEGVGRLVLPADGLIEVLGHHDAQYRAEPLVEVTPRARANPDLHARSPEQAALIERLGHHEPRLTGIEVARARSSAASGGRISGPTSLESS